MATELETLRARIRDLEARLAAAPSLEAELGNEQAILSRVLEAVPSGIVYVSPQGAILRANDKAQAFLGLSYDELSNRFTSDFAGATTYEDGRPCPVEDYPVTKVLTTGQPDGPLTLGVEQPDGEVRWAIFTAIPLTTSTGVGAVVTFVDITDRKAEEAAHREVMRRIQRSERMAALGTLVASVSHEINNPLTFVLGNLEFLAEDLEGAPPETLRLIEEASVGAERIRKIVRDMSSFTRSERVSAVEPVDVGAALTRAAGLVRSRLQLRARQVDDFHAATRAIAHADTLVEVFVNLLVNAIDAIPEGGADAQSITLHTRSEDGWVIAEIRDTGVGMTPAVVERVLEPFFTTKAMGEGTGLGLTIAQGLVSGLGGTLEFETAPGKGTVARVRLPQSETAEGTPAPRPAPASLHGLEVLVIDDEPSVLHFIRRALGGCRVTAVATATEGLELCATRTFDRIVCDLMMPGVSGIDFYRKLRAAQPGLADRMLFLTGGAFTKEAGEFVRWVPQPVIEKPIDAETLREALLALGPRR